MKKRVLRMLSAVLVFTVAGMWCVAAPWKPPARLWEKTILQAEERLPFGWGNDSLAFSADGKLLASADCRNGNIYLWDVARGKAVHILRHPGARSLDFSADGKTLASSGSQSVKLWDVGRWKNTATLRADTPPVYWTLFSPDGKTLTAVEHWGLRMWDLEKKKPTRDIEMPQRPLRVSAYPSVKRPLLAIRNLSGHYESITLIDALTRKPVLACAGHKTHVDCIALDREETILATTGFDGTLRLWDRGTGASIATIEQPQIGGGLCLQFNPEGTILAYGFWGPSHPRYQSGGRGFRLYEVPSGKVLAEVKDHDIATLTFSPDGSLLATAGTGGPIKLWSVPAAWQKKK
jgi:WD40 repeat protein